MFGQAESGFTQRVVLDFFGRIYLLGQWLVQFAYFYYVKKGPTEIMYGNTIALYELASKIKLRQILASFMCLQTEICLYLSLSQNYTNLICNSCHGRASLWTFRFRVLTSLSRPFSIQLIHSSLASNRVFIFNLQACISSILIFFKPSFSFIFNLYQALTPWCRNVKSPSMGPVVVEERSLGLVLQIARLLLLQAVIVLVLPSSHQVSPFAFDLVYHAVFPILWLLQQKIYGLV